MSWQLIFANNEFESMRLALLGAAPDEAAAILFCQEAPSGRMLVRSVKLATSADYEVQQPSELELASLFVSRAVKTAREQKESLIFVHTHPLSDNPQFSLADDRGESLLIPSIQSRVGGVAHGALVIGRSGFQGRIYLHNNSSEPIAEIRQVGRSIVRTHIRSVSSQSNELHDRSIRAFGADGQRRVQSMKVAVVGLGGTGSLVAQQLAHLGVREIALIDNDRIEPTNLNRVVGATDADVGRRKVDVARDMVAGITSHRTYTQAIFGNVVDAHVASCLTTSDFVFCCTDSHGSRAVINQLAYQFLIPTVDMGVRIDAAHGVISDAAGRIAMLAPGLACLQCQALLDAEEVRRDLMTSEKRLSDPYIVGDTEPQPAVISLNGVVSSLAVTAFLAAVAGVPIQSRRMNYRVLQGTVRSISAEPTSNCVVCSHHGALARGSSWPLLARSE